MEAFFTSKMQKTLLPLNQDILIISSPFMTYSLDQLEVLAVDNARMIQNYKKATKTLSPQALHLDSMQMLKAMKQNGSVHIQKNEVSLDALWFSQMHCHGDFLSLISAVQAILEETITFRKSIRSYLEPLFRVSKLEYKVIF